MKLSQWAWQEGIDYQMAWKWFKDRTLASAVRVRQTATGRSSS